MTDIFSPENCWYFGTWMNAWIFHFTEAVTEAPGWFRTAESAIKLSKYKMTLIRFIIHWYRVHVCWCTAAHLHQWQRMEILFNVSLDHNNWRWACLGKWNRTQAGLSCHYPQFKACGPSCIRRKSEKLIKLQGTVHNFPYLWSTVKENTKSTLMLLLAKQLQVIKTLIVRKLFHMFVFLYLLWRLFF